MGRPNHRIDATNGSEENSGTDVVVPPWNRSQPGQDKQQSPRGLIMSHPEYVNWEYQVIGGRIRWEDGGDLEYHSTGHSEE